MSVGDGNATMQGGTRKRALDWRRTSVMAGVHPTWLDNILAQSFSRKRLAQGEEKKEGANYEMESTRLEATSLKLFCSKMNYQC